MYLKVQAKLYFDKRRKERKTGGNMSAAAFRRHAVLTLIKRLWKQRECVTPYRLHVLSAGTSKTGGSRLYAVDMGPKEGTRL